MKRFILPILMCFLLAGHALAECRPAYQEGILARTAKLKKGKRAGIITTAITSGGTGLAGAYVGMIFLGYVGAWAALPVAAAGATVGIPFLISNLVRKAKLKSLVTANALVEQAYAEEDGEASLELLEKLKRHRPGLTLPDLKAEIRALNESRALCDGTVSGSKSKKKLLADVKKLERRLRGEK